MGRGSGPEVWWMGCSWMRTTTRVFSRSSHTWMKLLPTICRGMAMKTTPTMIAIEVTTLPECELGETSP